MGGTGRKAAQATTRTSGIMKSRRNHKTIATKRAGFTLLELVLVVTILSILFGIVFVGMNGATDNERLASSARGLCAFVTDVRNTAICGQKRLYLVYRPEQNEVSVRGSLGGAQDNGIKSFKLADGVRISGITIGDSKEVVQDTGKEVVIEISSQGDVQQHSIVLTGKSGNMRVKVDGVLGTVRVEE
jgi:prepilin-type N-terminal cleavage/methylation domain-containing protein